MKMILPAIILVHMAFIFVPGGFSTFVPTAHAQERNGRHDFDGTGVLHHIRTGSVVINDIYYRMAPGVEFKSPDAKAYAQVSFQRGDHVGFFKDEKGRIVELWRQAKPK